MYTDLPAVIMSHRNTATSKICRVRDKVWMCMTDITHSGRVHITFQHKGVWPVNFTKGERKTLIELFRWLDQFLRSTVIIYLNAFDS